ncbi:Hypothetical predicted protein [Cloeon dipterum]|uniref:Transposase Tc5 C-terminal domain-containing protein n=1 Tax=Cloeon dipterum TaxID=197152 RepID=A0A8S1DRJ8_9INSE|nr:Hypothetical predicted protein [Cloeon dipterum]
MSSSTPCTTSSLQQESELKFAGEPPSKHRKLSVLKDRAIYVQPMEWPGRDEEEDGENEVEYWIPEESVAEVKNSQKTAIGYIKKKEVIDFWQYADNPNGGGSRRKDHRSFSSVKLRFPFVKSTRILRKWKHDIINDEPMARSKIIDINVRVLECYFKAEEEKSIIKGRNFRKWALEAAKEMDLPLEKFRAGKSWLSAFTKQFSLTDRKITEFVTERQEKSAVEQKAQGAAFVGRMKTAMLNYESSQVYNLDHTGVIKEFHSARSFAIKGTKKVIKKAQSVSSLTHSSTLVPVCSADGTLREPAYFILAETNGQFGPLVKRTMLRPDNLYITCTKSGKMMGCQVKELFEKCLLPHLVPNKPALVLIDHWNGWRKQGEVISSVGDASNSPIRVEFIPEKTTGDIQPLDVMVNGPFKKLLRAMEDEIITLRLDENFNLQTRNNHIAIVSFAYHQHCSPRYKDMVRYAWFKPGYCSERGSKYITPKSYSFPITTDSCWLCDERYYMRCGWCAKFICFHHTLIDLHHCNEFNQ